MKGASARRQVTCVLLQASALLLFSCGPHDDRFAELDSGLPSVCDADGECDDGVPCTVDTCGVGGVCSSIALDERCPEDAPFCQAGVGCVEPRCTSNDACDDGRSCTLDTCGVGEECRAMAVDERCSAPGSRCAPEDASADPETGCTEATGCSEAADCDDDIDCTLDACGVDATCEHMLIDERCTAPATCSPSAGCFVSMDCRTDDDCDDGNFCNGRETCMPEFGCQPPVTERRCDDSNPCTLDRCDPEAGEGGACVFTCDDSMEACGCMAAEVPCDGTYMLSTPIAQSCAGGQVGYRFDRVTFTCLDDLLFVDTGSIPRSDANTPLEQDPRSTDGTFEAENVIAGSCPELYRLEGSFTDADSFRGTWTANFDGGGPLCTLLSGCTNQSIMVTATRVEP